MKTWNRPNFFIVGAMKAGTTSLFNCLDLHPEIFMCHPKEPHFLSEPRIGLGPGDADLAGSHITSWETYRGLFKSVKSEKAIGEASVSYLRSEKAHRAILENFPQSRIIIVLRQPADRAYSNFKHAVRDGRETIMDFRLALEKEEERRASGWSNFWSYRSNSFYSESVKRYKGSFGDRMLVVLYDDLRRFPDMALEDILQFLQVDTNFKWPLSVNYNVSGIPRLKGIHRMTLGKIRWAAPLKALVPKEVRSRLRAKVRLINLRPFPPMDLALRAELTDFFREEILRLQDIINRDLSNWLTSEEA